MSSTLSTNEAICSKSSSPTFGDTKEQLKEYIQTTKMSREKILEVVEVVTATSEALLGNAQTEKLRIRTVFAEVRVFIFLI